VKRFRSVGARLSLAFALLVVLALGVVYAVVVPTLERTLVHDKVEQLARTSETFLVARQFPYFFLSNPNYHFELEDFVNDAAYATNSRVVIFEPLSVQSSPSLRAIMDSRQSSSEDVLDDQVALRAVLTFARSEGVVTRDGQRYAEVAFAVSAAPEPTVVLFTASLADTIGTVRTVQRRVLAAGGIALGVALLVGFGGSSVFARRIRRLERAADRIASGQLDEPVVDTGADEVGELARAFEHMRGRLVQLEHARREFVANASHELRTPIFSLGGFIELLANEELDEETRREFLLTMQEQVERLGRLASDLLDLSRLDAGRLHVATEPVDLADLADALAAEFGPRAAVGGHRLEVEGGGEAEALGDEQRVLRIGRVLVENALRHTPGGTVVRICAERADGTARLVVEDAGPGIPREHAGHVFDRFYRIDGTRASGSGLGLAIARELAQLMGGTVKLEPSEAGARFVLTLPVAARAPRRREPVSA
jgi:signal transduction histidine kinase